MVSQMRRFKWRSSGWWFGSVLLLLLSLLLISCREAPPSVNKATPTARPEITPPANLVNAHTLTIGVYANYFPQEYIEVSSHQLTGFDIELIQAMAARMHLQPKFIAEDYSMLINDLVMNRFDIVVSAVSITPELQKKVDFIPYFKGGESLLVVKGNPARIYALADLCGQKVAIKEGTFEERELKDLSSMCLKGGKAAISAVPCTQYTAALQLLTAGRIAAIYQDSPVSDYFINQQPDRFERGGIVIAANVEGIAVRKNNTAMLNTLQQVFALMKADSSYRKLITKWGLTSGDITINDAKTHRDEPVLALRPVPGKRTEPLRAGKYIVECWALQIF